MSSRQYKVSQNEMTKTSPALKTRERLPSTPAHAPREHASRFCPRFHRAVELIGRRWTGAIINAMLGGAQCFNELLGIVPGLSDRLLTERLRELKTEGLVRRTVIPGPPVRVSYELTEAGRELEPAMGAIGKWAEKWVKI
jgi:DNA-binding HxlR family transcriptional regulator